jgi:dihydrofolate reductase
MRKIILNLAISLDGYIADSDGGFAWIKGDGDNGNDTKKQFNFPGFTDSIDTIVMGKSAYLDCPAETMESLKTKKIYVATHKSLEKKYDNVEFISGDVCGKILDLRKKSGKDIWLWGGAFLVDPFIKADVIDEYVIGIIPIILGEGKPLFLGGNIPIELRLNECTVQEGITILRYMKRLEKA